MACDDWLTRDELDALMPHMAFGPNLDIDGMVRDGMLFSIKLDGAEYFPRYAFNSSDYSYRGDADDYHRPWFSEGRLGYGILVWV